MSKFDIFFQESLLRRQEKGIYRSLQPIDAKNNLLQICCDGKEYLNFSSNDYLGLASHPDLIHKSKEWIDLYGSGSGASRLVTGNFVYNDDIEQRLANFLGVEAALIFASGWQANVAVLSCLLESMPKPVWVITDKLNHASLHYGCKAGQMKQIRFHHNDMNHLEKRLKAIPEGIGTKIIITETIFSMDGDISDIKRLRTLSDYYGAFLFLDDAHATGVLGDKGQGLAPLYADLIMGTFSKAWGSFGAYIAGSKVLCDWLINYCSGFIHTTALPPAVYGSISAAIDLMPDLVQERKYLNQTAYYVRQELQKIGLDIGHSLSHIIPIIIRDNDHTLLLAKKLKEKKIWLTAIRPPTVPQHSSRLRLTLSAAHESKDIEYLTRTISSLVKNDKMIWGI